MLRPRTLFSEAIWTSVSFSSESSVFGSDSFRDCVLKELWTARRAVPVTRLDRSTSTSSKLCQAWSC